MVESNTLKIPTSVPGVRAGAAGGEMWSFDSIVRAFGQELLAYIYRMTGGSESSEDVLQDVFLSLYKKDIELSTIENMRAYLYQIARNHILHLKRGAGRHRRKIEKAQTHFEHHGDLHGDFQRTISDQFYQKQTMQQVSSIVELLPEKQREVFILFELQEMSSKDISAALDIPHATVRSRLRLARESFKKKYQEMGIQDTTPESQNKDSLEVAKQIGGSDD